MPIEAVIFDLDGLLLDTERIAREAWARTAAEKGVEISEEAVRSLVGLRAPDIRARLAQHVGCEHRAEDLIEGARGHYRAILGARPADVKKGAHALLDTLDELALPRAIATSSLREYIAHKTRESGLPERMDAIVCGDEVEHGKPAPDIYLAAAEALGIAPHECMAFEDSGPGVASAARAGMHAVLIPDHGTPAPETLELASAVLPDLHAAIPYVRAAR